MRVAVAFDHRGVVLRERVIREIESLGHEVRKVEELEKASAMVAVHEAVPVAYSPAL